MEYIRLEEKKKLVIGNKVFRPFNDWELSDKDKEKALEDLGETEERQKHCLRELKEKLLGDDSFRYRSDDAYLLRILRVRKYNVQKAYENLKEFYTLRKQIRANFELPPDLKYILDKDIIRYMPYSDEEGRIIFFISLDRWDPDEVSFDRLFRAVSTIGDICTMNPRCQINGVMSIWDATGINTKHFTFFLKKINAPFFMKVALNGFTYRISKIIVINTNGLFRALYAIFRVLISRKIAQRVFMLGSDLNELYQHVNPAILPKNLGGMLEEEDCSNTQQILDNLPYLRYERSYI